MNRFVLITFFLHTHRWEGRDKDWSYISLVEKWLSLGASVIGGCCGLGPRDIRDIVKIVKSAAYVNT